VTRGTQAPYLSKSMNTLSFPPKEKGGRRTEGEEEEEREIAPYLFVGWIHLKAKLQFQMYSDILNVNGDFACSTRVLLRII